ncbi:hypothetical protein DUNSADRAFT_11658 [Dunaliella salina]|uniref:Encoded protein n=1 Tax=Dunaliella salina TaxID=3046 RepID=A0ABQ7GCU1_DUNSA|nr:hypothetical protein DUNSADRAFT_11658 [Dunaliella salina]|eukprot:KAF5832431.1 hypothetical protein DUNSADRAFT_11658 [Dunaliella salina]
MRTLGHPLCSAPHSTHTTTSNADQHLKELMLEMARWDSQVFDTHLVEEEQAAVEARLQRRRFNRASDSMLMIGPRSSPETSMPEQLCNIGVAPCVASTRVLPPTSQGSPPLNTSAFQNAFNCLASSVRATSTYPKPGLLPSNRRSLVPTHSSSHLKGQTPYQQQQQQQQHSSLPRASSNPSLKAAAGSCTRVLASRQRCSFPGQGDLLHDGVSIHTHVTLVLHM